jgi:hypothetical protein
MRETLLPMVLLLLRHCWNAWHHSWRGHMTHPHSCVIQVFTAVALQQGTCLPWRCVATVVGRHSRHGRHRFPLLLCNCGVYKALPEQIRYNTLVPLIYQCVETRSIEDFWLLSQPLPQLVRHHLRLLNVLERISWHSYEPLYMTNTSHRKHKTFLYEYPLHRGPFTHISTQQNAALQYLTPLAQLSFWPLKPAPKHVHERLLPRLSWRWTVLLPCDTHTKHVTYITVVLLPFVTYLLTLPCICFTIICIRLYIFSSHTITTF